MSSQTRPDVDRAIAARGWSPTTWDRLWARVNKTETCWLWNGPTRGYGHGMMFTGPGKAQRTYVHRIAWELLRGPIPEGLVIDHLCRVPACVNPDHLEPVTVRENNVRGIGPDLLRNDQTCRAGLHPWPEDARQFNDGYLRCGPCADAKSRRSKARATCDICGTETGSRDMARHRRRNHRSEAR